MHCLAFSYIIKSTLVVHSLILISKKTVSKKKNHILDLLETDISSHYLLIHALITLTIFNPNHY
jgi:hypothetical protein